MLKISTAKIAHAIARAREHDDIAASWENHIQKSFHEALGDTMLGSFDGDTAHGRLAEFIATLSKDEKTGLLAIVLIGQGNFSPESFDDAVLAVRSQAIYMENSYVIGIPLLAEYLREGMEKLGLPIIDRDDLGLPATERDEKTSLQ
jgi:hypothetical protein